MRFVMLKQFLIGCFAVFGALAAARGVEIFENIESPGFRNIGGKPHILDIPQLGESPVLDIREQLTHQGIMLSSGEFVLFSPKSRRVFIEASPENVYLIEDLLSPCCGIVTLVDVKLSIVKVSASGLREEIFQFQCRTKSGVTSKVNNETSEKKLKAEVEPIVGPDGHLVDVRVIFEGRKEDLQISFEASSTMKAEEEVRLWTSDDRTSKERYECMISAKSVFQTYYTRMEDGAAKDALVEKIKEQIKKVSVTEQASPK